MYLQKAGGIFKGLDDNPVFVGEYTHTGNYTPASHGDDKLLWVGGLGEYTHMGSDARKDLLVLSRKLSSLSDAKLSELAHAKGTTSDMKKMLLKELKRRADAAGGGSGGGGGSTGSGGFLGLSPTKVLIGGAIAVAAVVGIKKLTER